MIFPDWKSIQKLIAVIPPRIYCTVEEVLLQIRASSKIRFIGLKRAGMMDLREEVTECGLICGLGRLIFFGSEFNKLHHGDSPSPRTLFGKINH
jgi:hypothetical protein